jgi:hypothetical protein
MEIFCREMVTKIKSVKSEAELIKVVSGSMSEFRANRNSFNETGYIMNMIAFLRTIEQEPHSIQTLNNVKLAIAAFRQLQKENRERIC